MACQVRRSGPVVNDPLGFLFLRGEAECGQSSVKTTTAALVACKPCGPTASAKSFNEAFVLEHGLRAVHPFLDIDGILDKIHNFLRWTIRSGLVLRRSALKYNRHLHRLGVAVRSRLDRRKTLLEGVVARWAAEDERLREPLDGWRREDRRRERDLKISERLQELSVPLEEKRSVVKELYFRILSSYHKRLRAYNRQLRELREKLAALKAFVNSARGPLSSSSSAESSEVVQDIAAHQATYEAAVQEPPSFKFDPTRAQLLTIWRGMRGTGKLPSQSLAPETQDCLLSTSSSLPNFSPAGSPKQGAIYSTDEFSKEVFESASKILGEDVSPGSKALKDELCGRKALLNRKRLSIVGPRVKTSSPALRPLAPSSSLLKSSSSLVFGDRGNQDPRSPCLEEDDPSNSRPSSRGMMAGSPARALVGHTGRRLSSLGAPRSPARPLIPTSTLDRLREITTGGGGVSFHLSAAAASASPSVQGSSHSSPTLASHSLSKTPSVISAEERSFTLGRTASGFSSPSKRLSRASTPSLLTPLQSVASVPGTEQGPVCGSPRLLPSLSHLERRSLAGSPVGRKGSTRDTT
eukprot:RCo054286